jgi:hypothetical protein
MLLQYNIVVLMKSTLLIKVNPKPNTLSSPFSFHLSSFFVSLLVELLYLFVNDRKGFLFFLPWDMAMKNTRIARILCLSSSMAILHLEFSLKKEAKMKKNVIPNEIIREVEALVPTFWP